MKEETIDRTLWRIDFWKRPWAYVMTTKWKNNSRRFLLFC
jgi:hypothetical protein